MIDVSLVIGRRRVVHLFLKLIFVAFRVIQRAFERKNVNFNKFKKMGIAIHVKRRIKELKRFNMFNNRFDLIASLEWAFTETFSIIFFVGKIFQVLKSTRLCSDLEWMPTNFGSNGQAGRSCATTDSDANVRF